MDNRIKTTLLLGVLAGLMLVVGWLLGGTQGLTIALIFALVFNLITFFWGYKFVLWMYKAKEVQKGQHQDLVRIVKEVSNKAGIPMPKVYIIPNPSPNAFATGPSPNNSYVAFTEGILKLLNEEELKGVTAHELSHIKNRDILIATIAATVAAVISYVAAMARWAAIFGIGGDDDGPNIFELLLIGILAPLIALLIQLAISRSREYLADESAAKTLRNSKGLASALEKLEKGIEDKPMRESTTQSTTASLFIANPFKGRNMLAWFSTHPPIEERVKRLKSLKF